MNPQQEDVGPPGALPPNAGYAEYLLALDQFRHLNNTLGLRLQQALERDAARAPRDPAEAAADPGFKHYRPKAPPPFAGGPKEVMPIRAWLFNAHSYMCNVGFVTEAAKMSIIPGMLSGDASNWWMYVSSGQTGQPIPETWEDFKVALLRQFEPVNATDKARGQLLNLRQTGSVQEYVTLWRALALMLQDISEEDKRFRFINGLADHIQVHINSQAVVDLEQTIVNAERLDHFHSTRKPGASLAGLVLRQHRQDLAGSGAVPRAGPQPMELGSLEAWEDLSFEEQLLYLEGEDHEQLAALLDRSRPSLPRTGKAPFGPGNLLTRDQRDRAIRDNLCFRCLSGDHAVLKCPLPRPKGPSSSA